MTLRIDGSEDNGTRLRGIFTALDDKSGTRISATAAEGQFLSTDDPDVIIFRLKRGRLVQEGPNFATPRTLSFNSYDLPINLPAVDAFRGRGGNIEKELVLPEVWSRAYGGTAPTKKDELASRANFHFRLVEIAMMLMLPLLGVALAVPPKRSNSSLGIFVGIVMIVTYHKINQYAEDAGAHGRLQPELALWLPFLALVVLIMWMYHVIAHRPGGQPIGALEALFSKAGKAVRKVTPTRQFKRIEAKT
jgi:lipopolysaccharide export system permease protein